MPITVEGDVALRLRVLCNNTIFLIDSTLTTCDEPIGDVRRAIHVQKLPADRLSKPLQGNIVLLSIAASIALSVMVDLSRSHLGRDDAS